MLLYEFFSAVVCTVVSSAALGYCYSYLNALESQRIPDTDTFSLIYLPLKSSSLDSSIDAIFILLQLRFKYVSSVYKRSQHYLLKENIDLTVITFSTCILK